MTFALALFSGGLKCSWNELEDAYINLFTFLSVTLGFH